MRPKKLLLLIGIICVLCVVALITFMVVLDIAATLFPSQPKR